MAHLLYQHNKRYYKDILFHEFTHVFDCVRKKSVSPFSHSSYTEIHASFIKLASAFDIDWTKEINIKLSLDDTLIVFNERRTLQRFIETYLDELTGKFYKYKVTRDKNLINDMYTHVLYIFGYLQFCDIYCEDNRLKVNCFQKIIDIFGAELLCLFDIIKPPYILSEINFNMVQIIAENFCMQMLDINI